MTRRTIALAYGLCAFPFYAFAHGEGALIPFLVQFVLSILFLILVASIRFPLAGKLMLIGSYFLAAWLILSLDIPYQKNKALVNFILVPGPAAISLAVYMLLRNKYTKAKKQPD